MCVCPSQAQQAQVRSTGNPAAPSSGDAAAAAAAAAAAVDTTVGQLRARGSNGGSGGGGGGRAKSGHAAGPDRGRHQKSAAVANNATISGKASIAGATGRVAGGVTGGVNRSATGLATTGPAGKASSSSSGRVPPGVKRSRVQVVEVPAASSDEESSSDGDEVSAEA